MGIWLTEGLASRLPWTNCSNLGVGGTLMEESVRQNPFLKHISESVEG